MFYTYILQRVKDKSLYIGYTADLKNRVEAHNKGNNISTKYRRPYDLIYYEVFLDKNDAKNREVYLKSGWGRKSIDKLLKNYLD